MRNSSNSNAYQSGKYEDRLSVNLTQMKTRKIMLLREEKSLLSINVFHRDSNDTPCRFQSTILPLSLSQQFKQRMNTVYKTKLSINRIITVFDGVKYDTA